MKKKIIETLVAITALISFLFLAGEPTEEVKHPYLIDAICIAVLAIDVKITNKYFSDFKEIA